LAPPSIEAFRRAPADSDVRTKASESFTDCQIDAAAAACNECYPSSQDARLKEVCNHRLVPFAQMSNGLVAEPGLSPKL
jgi:hypothetical protein